MGLDYFKLVPVRGDLQTTIEPTIRNGVVSAQNIVKHPRDVVPARLNKRFLIVYCKHVFKRFNGLLLYVHNQRYIIYGFRSYGLSFFEPESNEGEPVNNLLEPVIENERFKGSKSRFRGFNCLGIQKIIFLSN